MPNQNHPRTRKTRKRRRKHRQSGDIIPPTEFWTNEEGEVVDNTDSSYADVTLSPVQRDKPISSVIAEANRVLEGSENTDQSPPTSTPKMTNPPPLDDRLVEAIASRVEQKMMGQFNALSEQLTNTLGGRIKSLEETVGILSNENKQLKADIRALTVRGVDPENATSIVDMIKHKVEEVMAEKQVLCKKEFSYECTLVVSGVTQFPGEDPKNIAETLFREGLRLPHLIDRIVRVFRMPFNTRNGKPGHVKIEMVDEHTKREVLQVTGRLKGYTTLGRKVVVRSSMPFDMRVMVGNMHTLVQANKLSNELMVAPNGSIRQLNRQMGYQTAQQWGQQQNSHPDGNQMTRQQQTYQPGIPPMAQPPMAQPSQPQMSQTMIPPQMAQTTQPMMTNQLSYSEQPTLQPRAQQVGQPPRPRSVPNYAPQSYANVTQGIHQTRNAAPAPVSSQLPVPPVPVHTQSLSQGLHNLFQNVQG